MVNQSLEGKAKETFFISSFLRLEYTCLLLRKHSYPILRPDSLHFFKIPLGTLEDFMTRTCQYSCAVLHAGSFGYDLPGANTSTHLFVLKLKS